MKIENGQVKKKIYELLNTEKLMVVSTVNLNGNPESATVGFGVTKEFEIIFGTDVNTRKVHNIAQNYNVSMVINGPNASVQYEGSANLSVGKELEVLQRIFYKKTPSLAKYSKVEGQIYYKVTPVWVRYIDHTSSPGTVTEFQF